jgi:hypothetical protein
MVLEPIELFSTVMDRTAAPPNTGASASRTPGNSGSLAIASTHQAAFSSKAGDAAAYFPGAILAGPQLGRKPESADFALRTGEEWISPISLQECGSPPAVTPVAEPAPLSPVAVTQVTEPAPLSPVAIVPVLHTDDALAVPTAVDAPVA